MAEKDTISKIKHLRGTPTTKKGTCDLLGSLDDIRQLLEKIETNIIQKILNSDLDFIRGYRL